MANDILKLIPVIQSASVLGDNIKFYDSKNKKAGDFIKQGVKNIVSLELVKETSNFI